MQVNDIEKYLSEVFPPENALDYDNVGLIAGNRDRVVYAKQVSFDIKSKAKSDALQLKSAVPTLLLRITR